MQTRGSFSRLYYSIYIAVLCCLSFQVLPARGEGDEQSNDEMEECIGGVCKIKPRKVETLAETGHGSNPTEKTETKRPIAPPNDVYSSICLNGNFVCGKNPDKTFFEMNLRENGDIYPKTGGQITPYIEKDLVEFYGSNIDKLKRSGLWNHLKEGFLRRRIPQPKTNNVKKAELEIIVVKRTSPPLS